MAEAKEELPKPETGAGAAPAAAAASTPTQAGSSSGENSGHSKTIKSMSGSSSFDSQANLGQSFRYKMSAEATKLFQTLQESPLPVEVSSGCRHILSQHLS